MQDTPAQPVTTPLQASASTPLGNIHQSTGQIIGQMITAGAAMLAFFFTFQAIMVSNFPNALEKLKSVQWLGYPIGKYTLVMICLAIILFNVWALSIITALIRAFRETVLAGDELEHVAGAKGLLFSRLKQSNRGRTSPSFILTCITMTLICAIWLGFLFVALGQ